MPTISSELTPLYKAIQIALEAEEPLILRLRNSGSTHPLLLRRKLYWPERLTIPFWALAF